MTGPAVVAHVVTKLELGGAQRNTLYTVAHLDRRRFRSLLITGEPGLLDEEARSLPKVEFHRVPSLVRPIHAPLDLRALMDLTLRFKRLRPAIVHTHSSKAGILGRWAARLAGTPVIIHSIHGFGITPDQPPLLRRALIALERRTGRITTRFFAVSEANRRQGVALGLFPPERCAVIRSGIDLEAFRACRVDRRGKRLELGLDPDRPVVGMVAPFKPQKRPLDFLRVAASVRRRRADAQFLMVGDGALRPAIEAGVRSLGLTGTVKLAGWRWDVPEVLRCLDALALTSAWEGLPRVYLEALASGVPVVGTAVDGAAEVVRDGENGFLVAPGDVEALAERLLWLLDHPEEAGRMGACGVALPPEFDARDMVRRQEAEYERLLEEARAAGRLSVTRGCGTPAQQHATESPSDRVSPAGSTRRGSPLA
jgi:glycosyltransferase involved in cell wall biosynthesis